MGANQFHGLAAFLQELSALGSLLHAGNPDRFALGANHRDAVVGFEGIHILLGFDSKHQLVLAAFHRLHRLRFVGGLDGQGQRESRARDKADLNGGNVVSLLYLLVS
jgi:hypothetical protein